MWFMTKANGRPVHINTDHIGALYESDRSVVVQGIELTLSDDDFSNLYSKLFPTRKKVSKEDTELADFLNTLHKLTGGKSAAILSPERNKKLTALLKTMTPQQLMTAAENLGKDKWMQGENDRHKRYGDIDYLLRPAQAAKWAEVNPEEKRKKMF